MSAPDPIERCAVCREQYCDARDDVGAPIHRDCVEELEADYGLDYATLAAWWRKCAAAVQP